MVKHFLKLIILSIMLVGLPRVGMVLCGFHLPDLMEFPPMTRYVIHASFSFPVFLGLGLFCLMVILPFAWRAVVFAIGKPNVQQYHLFEMPLLGYMGYLLFGLECAVIGDMIMGSDGNGDSLIEWKEDLGAT